MGVDPVLVIDKAARTVCVGGERVLLQDAQYKLLCLLAMTPGIYVSYSRIYAELWGEAVVESTRHHFQKRRLLLAISRVAPSRGGIVTTVPRWGFRLNLTAEDVSWV